MAWRLAIADVTADWEQDEPPLGPEDATALEFFATGERVGWHTAMEIIFARGKFLEPGPATVWMRPRVALVEGEEFTPLQRVMVAADGGNGVSAPLDWSGFIFINTDLTVHLLRPPVGEWVCLDAVTHVDGIGITDTALSGRDRGASARGGTELAGAGAVVDSPAAIQTRRICTVAYFKDADEVYAYIGKLFEQLAEDDELSPRFQKANTIVQYQYRDPESQDHREADGG